MDQSNVFQYTTECWLIDDGPGGQPQVTLRGGKVVIPYDWEFDWVQRDRQQWNMGRLSVIPIAAVDIASGPLQPLGLLLLVDAMVRRRGRRVGISRRTTLEGTARTGWRPRSDPAASPL